MAALETKSGAAFASGLLPEKDPWRLCSGATPTTTALGLGAHVPLLLDKVSSRCSSGVEPTAALGVMQPVARLLKEGTLECFSGVGRTAVHEVAMPRRYVPALLKWVMSRCCNGADPLAALGMHGLAPRLLRGDISNCCSGAGPTDALGMNPRVQALPAGLPRGGVAVVQGH